LRFRRRYHPVEVRVERQDDRIARVSAAGLVYMYRCGVALEERLRYHRRALGWVAAEEYDLFEGMRLSTRIGTVDGNIRRTARRNDRMRTEFLRRGLEGV